MKNQYFDLINELIRTINTIPYKEWGQIGADQLLNILNKTKALQKTILVNN